MSVYSVRQQSDFLCLWIHCLNLLSRLDRFSPIHWPSHPCGTSFHHIQVFISDESLLVHWSLSLVFMLVADCFDYFSFLISLERRKYEASNFVLFKLVFSVQCCLKFHMNLDGCVYFFKRCYRDFVGIALSLSFALGNIISWLY